MTNVIWTKYKSWSGCKIPGIKEFELNTEQAKKHMWRAVWLTAKVEGGGKFGAINSYDGAGMSAGLEHRIAVYPKTMNQGSLWKLIRELELHAHCEALNKLFLALKDEKMFLAQDGSLRHVQTGRLISGSEIRNLVTPVNGQVPKSGENWNKAKEWALLFHELFSNEKTYETQVNSTIVSLLEGNQQKETEAYKLSLNVEHPTVLEYGENISAEHDLAWCVYHSFSVNAPGKGRERLQVSKPDKTKEWPKRLIRTLGTTNYGRWYDTFDGGNRYDRTRVYAMSSGMWPEELFEDGPLSIMPKNL